MRGPVAVPRTRVVVPRALKAEFRHNSAGGGSSIGLEGSRFRRWQLDGLLAGGSRERLEMWQLYGPVVSAARNRRDGQNIALGHSREPPATNR